MDLMDVLFMDHRLMNFMNHILVNLVDHRFVHLSYDFLVVLVDHLLFLSVDNRSCRVCLHNRGCSVGDDLSRGIDPADLGCFSMGEDDGF